MEAVKWGKGRKAAEKFIQDNFVGVKKLVDAKVGEKVHVTVKDIAAKGRKKHGDCALARACKRELKADAAIISLTRAYLVRGDTAVRYALDDRSSREITAFDRGAAFAPGEYFLNAPSSSKRLGKKRPWGGTKGRAKRRSPLITLGVRASLRS